MVEEMTKRLTTDARGTECPWHGCARRVPFVSSDVSSEGPMEFPSVTVDLDKCRMVTSFFLAIANAMLREKVHQSAGNFFEKQSSQPGGDEMEMILIKFYGLVGGFFCTHA